MNKQCKEMDMEEFGSVGWIPSQGFCGQISKGNGEKHAGTETSFLHVKLTLDSKRLLKRGSAV